ncbi:hypothetical protein [Acidithiobacillus sp.]
MEKITIPEPPFHRPETLAEWLGGASGRGLAQVADAPGSYGVEGRTFLARLQSLPALRAEGLWPAQVKAIRNLERSLRENRPPP